MSFLEERENGTRVLLFLFVTIGPTGAKTKCKILHQQRCLYLPLHKQTHTIANPWNKYMVFLFSNSISHTFHDELVSGSCYLCFLFSFHQHSVFDVWFAFFLFMTQPFSQRACLCSGCQKKDTHKWHLFSSNPLECLGCLN